MASQLRFKGIVLRKTKLGEADLIITFLVEDGSSVQAVAKGARKPKSSFSSRLELFSCAEIFCAQSKGLPLIQEARLCDSHQGLRIDFDKATASSVVAEVMAKSIHEEVPCPRLFALAEAAFHHLELAESTQIYSIALATCLKVFAFTGLRPSFAQCVACGADIFGPSAPEHVALSHPEGGCLCPECSGSYEVIREQGSLIQWLHVFLYSTFDQVKETPAPEPVLSFGFHFVQEWSRMHMGACIKSIPFLLTNANFPSREC